MLIKRVLLLLVAMIASASAQPAAPPPARQKTIAIIALTTLGAEDTSPASKAFTTQLEQAVPALGGAALIPALQVADAAKKSKKLLLRNCQGDVDCLAELGKLVGADTVVAGEIGGLGDTKVVYLISVDVNANKEIGVATVPLGSNSDTTGGAKGALVRMLSPQQFLGTLNLSADVKGATAYVDGVNAGVCPLTMKLAVGTHAVRVTHPEYRDFVRFVEVPFENSAVVTVGLTQYPVVQSAILQNQQRPTQRIIYHGTSLRAGPR
jgi:hypothetical protein